MQAQREVLTNMQWWWEYSHRHQPLCNHGELLSTSHCTIRMSYWEACATYWTSIDLACMLDLAAQYYMTLPRPFKKKIFWDSVITKLIKLDLNLCSSCFKELAWGSTMSPNSKLKFQGKNLNNSCLKPHKKCIKEGDLEDKDIFPSFSVFNIKIFFFTNNIAIGHN